MSQTAFRLDIRHSAEHRFSARIQWQHGVCLLIAFFGSVALSSVWAAANPQAQPVMSTLISWLPFMLKGFGLNLVMSFCAMALATTIGIAMGLLQLSPSKWLSHPARLLTHVFRNSPWLVILFAAMYLMPISFRVQGVQIDIPDWIKATLAFSLPVAANISEILRGAVNSIPRGQWESAQSLAFTNGQTLRWIILPQCIKRVLPPWMNWYALLTLVTPMASILGVKEVLSNAQAAMEAAGARPEFLFPFYLFLLCLFFCYIYPIALWTKKLERKYAVID